MSQTVTAGLSSGLPSSQSESASVLKSFWARLLLTIVSTAVIWMAWAPLGHWIPSLKWRVILVLFVGLTFVWRVWPRAARAFGNFQARLILTIIYAILVLPFGVLVRLLADPLRIKKRPTAWIEHSNEKMDIQWAKRQ